jgi:hypothetical protein
MLLASPPTPPTASTVKPIHPKGSFKSAPAMQATFRPPPPPAPHHHHLQTFCLMAHSACVNSDQLQSPPPRAQVRAFRRDFGVSAASDPLRTASGDAAAGPYLLSGCAAAQALLAGLSATLFRRRMARWYEEGLDPAQGARRAGPRIPRAGFNS